MSFLASRRIVLFFLFSSAFLFFSFQGCPPHELKALSDFKYTLNESNTENWLMSWKGQNCCAWDGVECLGGHLYKLDLILRSPWEIPSQLGGLSSLRYLHISLSAQFTRHLVTRHVVPFYLTSRNLSWLSQLSSLEYLSLSYVKVSDKKWESIIGSLLHLKHLDLHDCSLPTSTIPISLLNLSSLTYLDLSGNSFSNIPTWMVKLTSLTHLDLCYNNITGSIPNAIGNLTGLQYLDLSRNALTGQIPLSLGLIRRQNKSLSYLNLAYNQLSGPIPPSIGNLLALEKLCLNDNQLQGNIPADLGNIKKLRYIDLFNNHLSGSLPLSFALLSALTHVDVSRNRLNESIPSALMLPSSLVELFLSNNSINGTITEVFFQKSLSLKLLYLSNSGLTINISSTWIPPFQLDRLLLKKCQIGGPIPSWISTQINLYWLDLSGTQLTGNLPSWLWEIPTVRLSDNHLQGSFTPTSGSSLYSWDLSMNELSGPLPLDIDMLLSNARLLILAYNKFEGQIPASVGNALNLIFLDLSNNCLTGNVPTTLGNLTYLRGLHLENNYLQGEIPKELGRLPFLGSLRIGKNSLQGHLPSSLRNLSSLELLDVGDSNLTGNIPHWIANFSSLHVLVMRSNNFRGLLLPDIGGMPELRVLDLSSNHFSGTIPHSYFRLPAMQNSSADGKILSIFSVASSIDDIIMLQEGLYEFQDGMRGPTFDFGDSIDIIVKGQERHYEYVYSSMTCFDLSNNRLSGPLPREIDNLKGLMYLNLSMNSLRGPIPQSIGNLVQLESLDLSFNNFSGNIPPELGNLTYLAHLNLSHNNLSGRIPQEGGQMLTFDEWSYKGNPNLWGCPLERNRCRPVAGASPAPAMGVEERREVSFEFVLYWMCFGLSVGVGFSGLMVLLMMNLSLRVKYFEVMDKMIEKMDIVINKLKP